MTHSSQWVTAGGRWCHVLRANDPFSGTISFFFSALGRNAAQMWKYKNRISWRQREERALSSWRMAGLARFSFGKSPFSEARNSREVQLHKAEDSEGKREEDLNLCCNVYCASMGSVCCGTLNERGSVALWLRSCIPGHQWLGATQDHHFPVVYCLNNLTSHFWLQLTHL